MLSHSLGSTHTLHAEEVHQEPNEVVYAFPQQGENTRVPRDLEVQGIPRMLGQASHLLHGLPTSMPPQVHPAYVPPDAVDV
jgi:hypothetical protein